MGCKRTPVGAKCGTVSGFRVHKWHKEVVCQPCLDAYHESMRIYNRRYSAPKPPKLPASELKERSRISHRKWYRSNPEKVAATNAKRRALKIGALSEPYTVQRILDLYGTDCHICKEPIDFEAPRSVQVKGWQRGLHLDHVIPLCKGGTDLIENIRPSHGFCNLSKAKTVLLVITALP